MRRRTIEERGRTIPLEWLDPVAAVNTEVAVGTLLLIVIGLTTMVWGAAQLSYWSIHRDWADIGARESLLAMVRLGAHRLRWGNAFSPRTEALLPGAVRFWIAFAAESVVLALLFWPVWRVMGPRPGDPMPVFIQPTPVKHPRNERRKARRAAQAAATPPPATAAGGGNGGGGNGGGPGGGGGGPWPGEGGPGGGGGTWTGGPASDRLRVPQADGRRLILGQARD